MLSQSPELVSEKTKKPSLLLRFVLGTILLYQRIISPLLGPRCRFYPSCSQYAVEACATHGVFKGIVYTLLRLGKCHPLHPGGVDLVPPRESQEKTV